VLVAVIVPTGLITELLRRDRPAGGDVARDAEDHRRDGPALVVGASREAQPPRFSRHRPAHL
jgi:hypothetical protein